VDLAGVKIAVEPFVGTGNIFHAYSPGDAEVDDLTLAFRGDLVGGDPDDDLLHIFLVDDAAESLFRGVDHKTLDGFPVELRVVVDESHEIVVEVVVLVDHRLGDLAHGAGAPDHQVGVGFGFADQVAPEVRDQKAVSGKDHGRYKELHHNDRDGNFQGR